MPETVGLKEILARAGADTKTGVLAWIGGAYGAFIAFGSWIFGLFLGGLLNVDAVLSSSMALAATLAMLFLFNLHRAEVRLWRERALLAEQTLVSVQSPGLDYLSLQDALLHVALESEWAITRCPEGKVSAAATDREMHDALARGDIVAFGTRFKSWTDRDAAATEIGKDWWNKGQFMGARIMLEPNAESRAFRYEVHGGGCYEEVHVRRSDVNRMWPARPNSARTNETPFSRWRASLPNNGVGLLADTSAYDELFGGR